ncbi:MAG: hypothetical protein V3U78_09995 [Thiotrichaceae bacterium]
MATESIGTTFNWGGVIAGITNIAVPGDERKEFETTSLSDTREQFKLSAMGVGQECTLTLRLDPESPAFAAGVSQSAGVITLAKQTSASASGATYTFDGFTRIVGQPVADVGSTEGLTQDVTIRLTSEVVPVDEV